MFRVATNIGYQVGFAHWWGMNFYDSYMRSAEWANKRAQRLEIDGRKCRTCGHTGDVWRQQKKDGLLTRPSCLTIPSLGAPNLTLPDRTLPNHTIKHFCSGVL